MKRTIGVLAIGLVVLSASPAAAKVDVERIVVEGPGLATPIELVDEDAFDFLIGGRMAGPSGAEVTAVPHGDLSAGYTVSVHQRSIDAVEVLTLYPFADPAWLRLGPDNGWVGMILRGDGAPKTDRWVVVNQRQLDVLREHGLSSATTPAPPPSPPSPGETPVAAAAAVDETPTSSSRTGWGMVVPVLAAVIVASALGRAGWRRRLGTANQG